MRAPALPAATLALVAVLAAPPLGAVPAPPVTAGALRCEGRTDPLGIDERRPQLSWQLRSEERDVVQSAYQIQVTREGAPVFDSGRVVSDRSVHVPYAGPELVSSGRYAWRVRVWDGAGRPSPWSEAGRWEMGVLAPEEWKARWIAPGGTEGPSSPQPAPMLRGLVRVKGAVRAARAYVTALGLYELEINGRRVGDALFTPGFTSYDRRLPYQSYDVTPLLRQGENALGATLADGWFRGYLHLAGGMRRNTYGEGLAFLCQLRVEYADGRVEVHGTDGTWRSATGPVLRSDLYLGERYDARLERPGWSEPGHDVSSWQPVRLPAEKRTLVASPAPPVRRVEEVRPVALLRTPAGETVVDLGRNLVGRVRLRARGPAGHVITLRHAEALDASGNLYTANLRAADQRVEYVLAGRPEEVYEPRFTLQGFRYVAVSGLPDVSLADVTGIVIRSDLPSTGRFESSHPLLDRLQEAIRRSQEGNSVEIPTDCPQRDERLGWTGDVQVFAATAAFNRDVSTFLGKWLADLAADQRADGAVPNVVPDVVGRAGKDGHGAAGWADAAVLVPWELYLATGDRRLLERQYPSMKAWVEYVRRQAGPDHVWRTGSHFGDWLAFASDAPDEPGATTGKDLIATAFHARSTELLARVATMLGKEADAREYGSLLVAIRGAFLREFVTSTGRVGENTQTAYALALGFDLLPPGLREEAARRLAADVSRRGHLTTGFLGTPHLAPVLARTGRLDLAYRLLLREEYPSWLYPITRGATTLWERWDGIRPDGSFQDPRMNSFNHVAHGAVGAFLYRWVAGLDVDPAEPGYRHVIAHPSPGGGLTSASARLETPYGEASCGWSLSGGTMTVSVTVPPNARGTVRLPGAAGVKVTDGGRPADSAPGVRRAAIEGGDLVLEVGSGRYAFAWAAAPPPPTGSR